MNYDLELNTTSIETNIGETLIEIELPGGARGVQGETGPRGPQGVPGVQGERGIPGVPGPQGIQGETGPANTLTIGTVEGGEEAGATITGESPNQVLNLTLPKGDTGETGPQGVPGSRGDDGFSPTITSSKTGKTTTLTITDADGTHTATILDGEDGASTWGDITGTLSNQTDLQSALNSKASSSDIPTKTSDLTNDSGFITSSSLPTKVSDLTNDSGFITNTVNNLTNYYTKTNTYSKSEVDNLISTVSSLDIEVVQTLPTQDISTSTIYLVPNSSSSQENIYDEYIYVNNNWELIGNTSISLSWGNISGTLSNQTDLQEVLDGKIPYTQVTDRTFSIWDSADGWYKLPYNTMIRYKGGSTNYYLLQGDLSYIFISSHHSGNQKIYALFESGGLKTGFTSSTSGTYPKIVLNKDDIKNNLTTSYTGYALDASQGKALNDGKQDTLVSGTNIKTINNESILGSGNITISAGGGGTMTDMRVNNSSVVTDNVGNIVTESAYDPSTNKIATINDLPTVPTKTSDLTNDSGFIDNTYHDNNKQDTLVSGTNIKTINNESILGSGNISLAATETDPVFTASAASGITSSDITKWDNAIQYYSWDTSHNVYNVTHNSSLASLLTVTNNKINISNIPTPSTISDSSNTIPTTQQVYTALQKKQDKITNSNKLSYTLLEDTPTIPDEVTESTVSGWGFTKNTGTYSKPSGGIPKTDLASAVQTSLGKADTALQSYTETDPTVPSHVKSITQANITSWNNKSDFSGSYNDLTNKPTIPTATSDLTNDSGFITTESDPVFMGSPAANILTSDITHWNNKQDALVSGTNIKTINNQSIVGSGNLEINSEITGAIKMYAGSTAPTGYLTCDGSAVSRTDYADLFSVIGTTYGTGDGSTTFNLPNLKGRVAVGLDGDDTDFDSLGATGGEKEHTLTVDEIPSHHHTLSPTGRLGNFTNGSGYTTIVNNTYGSVGNINSSNVGGSAAHNIMQPYITLNYIIKY